MLVPEVREHVALASFFFEKHELRHERILKNSTGVPIGAIWQIGQPRSSSYYTEIVATPSCGALIVHGDVGTCRFAAGDRDPFARLAWMGARHPDDFSYPAEKASIGTENNFPTIEFSESAAIREALTARREGRISATAARAAVDYLRKCDADARGLYDVVEPHDPDYWDHPFGKIHSFGLIVSVLALRKCYELVSPGYATRNYWARPPW